MMRRASERIVVLLILAVAVSTSARADVKLPSVLNSHMVLQRDMPVPVWGWAEAGEEVTVTFAGQTKTAKADDAGNWKVTLDKLEASAEPRSLTVKGKNEITLEDILVGEVWIGSGQSNMERWISASKDASKEIAEAKHPNIRLLLVPHVVSPEPQKDVKAKWAACSPETIPKFSAVTYFFGREIHQELKVPVGLIATSRTMTRIEPWMPEAPDPVKPPWAPIKGDHQNPCVLYNGMVHPLIPFAFRGALWYQGESNVLQKDGMEYLDKQKALIEGWRKAWGQGDFPFYFVQLAPLGRWYEPGQLPAFWEAQTATLAVPNTGMAVIHDTVGGAINNIHPPDKQTVGKRLSLWALAKVHGKDITYSGPLYKKTTIEGGKIRLSFDHVGGGLMASDSKPLTHFTIAGEDKKFVPAQAEVDGGEIVVSAEGVAAPKAVRFAWEKSARPNLANKEGLPASPFRTDKW